MNEYDGWIDEGWKDEQVVLMNGWMNGWNKKDGWIVGWMCA